MAPNKIITGEKGALGKAFILWLLGVPFSLIILLWLFGFLK